MAGGTWIDQNKVRPGVYINYKSAPASLATMGERGVVAIARVLDWGEQGKFYTIEDPSDCAKLGHAITDDEMLFLRQILLGSNRTQGATKVLLWNLAQVTTPVSSGSRSIPSALRSVGDGSSSEPIQEFEGCTLASSDTTEMVVYDSDGNIITPVEGATYYVSDTCPDAAFWIENVTVDSVPVTAIVTSDAYNALNETFSLKAYAASQTVGTISDCQCGSVTEYGCVIWDSEGSPVAPIEGAVNYAIVTINGRKYPVLRLDATEEVPERLILVGTSGEFGPSDTFDVVGLAPASSGDDSDDDSDGVAAKASATAGNLTATALYDGTFGNRLSLSVTAGEGGTFIVQTLLDGLTVDSQVVSAISGLVPNQYCSFSGEGEITTTTSPIAFSGGSTGAPTATAYSDFLNALELQKFDVVIYDGEDATIKGAFIDFVKRLSNQEGVKCQAVVSDANNPDNECVINVYPQSVTLTDGSELSAPELTWWVGGASAGANVFDSLTYAAYPDAVSINPILTSSQQEAAINAGKFALISQFDKIQVLTDINSFTTFSVEKGKAFRKNRVIRTVFGLCNDIYRTFALYYIGAVHNDEEGRKALKAEILDLMNKYQGNRALQNVEAEDVTVLQGVDSDAVVIEIYCQPVDSIEKIYINITIS